LIDVGDAYLEVQDRFIEVVSSANQNALGTAVPATPDWTVKDVLAHVTGLASDTVDGSLPVINPLEQWRDSTQVTAMTDGQVASRKDRNVDQVLSEWREATEPITSMRRGDIPFPAGTTYDSGAVFVTDLTIHEQDVRAALGLGRPPTDPALSIAMSGYCFALDYRLRHEGVGALTLRYEGKERLMGEGRSRATLEADRYELVRSMAGRRNRSQLLALKWEGDSQPFLPLISTYGERIDALTD
jgi:uncharacterized protein (TIGR03083 family)